MKALQIIATGEGAGPTQFEYSFFTVMFILCVLVGLVTVAYVIRRIFSRQGGEVGGWEVRGAAGRLYAVARTTLAEGLRAKVAAGFALMIVVAIPLFWLTARGDGTIKGQVQMFVSYSLGFTGFILSLLTILFACRSLSMEIASRQIYGVVSKPIPRWQIVVGKWCGVMFLDVVLIVLACLGTYVGTLTTVSRFKTDLRKELSVYGGLTPAQAAQAVDALDNVRGMGGTGYDSPIIPVMAEVLRSSPDKVAELLLRLPEQTRVNLRRFDEVRRQVLIARASVSPELPKVGEEVNRRYAEMKSKGLLPEGMSPAEIRDQLRKEAMSSIKSVPPGAMRVWKLQGPKPESGRDYLVSLRFKITPSGYLSAMQTPEGPLEEETLLAMWGLGDPSKAGSFVGVQAHPVSTFNEFEIPEKAVAPDGTVMVSFANVDPRRVEAVFDFPYALQVLYRVGSFELNMVQVAAAMIVPLACLAAFGVCASTFLSFPVACLIVITLFIISSSIGFVSESLGATPDYTNPDEYDLGYEVRRRVVQAVDWILDVGDVDPVRHLIEGRVIGWDVIGQSAWKFAGIKGMGVLLIGVFIFRRRELAAVTV